MRQPKRWLAALVAATTLAFTAGCGDELEVAIVQAPPVATASARVVDLEESIRVSGELVAHLRTSLSAEISGRVTGVALEEGDPVEVGTPVIEIDPERRELEVKTVRAQAAQADATFDKEQRELARVRTLHDKAIASQSQLDAAETALALARAGAEAARARLGVSERALRDASVAAPFAGLLARRYVNLGEFVQPGTPLFDLVALDPIDIVFRVAEVDSSRIHKGQQVAVSVAPYPDRQFAAVVDLVSPTIDRDTRTLRVRATLPNPEGTLRPGLFARADLGVEQRRGVVVVPEEAVLERPDGTVVFTLGGEGRVERRLVRTGGSHPEGVEILTGVIAGETVIVRGHTNLVHGAPVRVTDPPDASADSGIALSGAVAGQAL
jgi:membrane fusion protein (multidrug efflux system)